MNAEAETIPTRFGFQWGNATIQRDCDTGRHRILTVSTPKARIDLYITPTGKVRVWDVEAGKELKP